MKHETKPYMLELFSDSDSAAWQSEQEKYQFRTHVFEFLLGPQSLKVADISLFELHGGRDFGCNEPFD